MSPLKGVSPLCELSLSALSVFIKESTLFYSRRLVRIQNVGTGDLIPLLLAVIGDFREFIFRNVPFTLSAEVASRILKGIEASIQRRKRFSNPSANEFSNYSKEIFCIREFTGLIVVPSLRELNIWSIEESLRSNLLASLGQFSGLRSLDLGPGSEGQSDSSVIYHNVYLKGLSMLHHLTSLTVLHDCSDLIIMSLSENCHQSLLALNFNFSKYVSDYSVKFLRSFRRLRKLSAFKTGLSPSGKIAVLTGLYSTLEYFDSGEFLNFISVNKFSSPFILKELFMAENAHQLHKWCPEAKKIIFDSNHHTNLSHLPNYRNVEVLQIIGGSLSLSAMEPTLKSSIGRNLSGLALVKSRNLEERFLQGILTHCSCLESLALIDCQGFGQIESYISFESDSLKILSISGDITSSFLLSLLQLQSLQKLEVGRQILSDKLLLNAITNDDKVLKNLEDLIVHDPIQFRLGSLYSLIEALPNLKTIRGLQSWNCLSRVDIANFQRFIRVNNMGVHAI